jgi:hypothetical protein
VSQKSLALQIDLGCLLARGLPVHVLTARWIQPPVSGAVLRSPVPLRTPYHGWGCGGVPHCS